VAEGEGGAQPLHHLQQQAAAAQSDGGGDEEEEEAGLVMLEFLSWVRELLFDTLVMVAQVRRRGAWRRGASGKGRLSRDVWE
jgi:hypothetical protein